MVIIYLKPRSSYSAIKVTSKFLAPSMPGKINTGQSVTSTQWNNESVTCLAVILGCLPTSSLKFLGAHSVKTLSQSNVCKLVEKDSSRLWKNMGDGFITTKRMTDQRFKIFKETRRSCQLTARLRCCLGVNSRCYLQEITRGMFFCFFLNSD